MPLPKEKKRRGKIPESEVREMLDELQEHFNEPVMPVSRYCNALETWASIMMRKKAYDGMLGSILTDIHKSNLLARMIYGGEKLRTKPCPIHKGEWSGQAMLEGCTYDCDGSGWLREPEEQKEDVDSEED